MLAGLRVVSVSTVSLVTVGVLVGVKSLGYFFTDGFQRRIEAEILTGIVMTLLVALIFDLLLLALGRVLMVPAMNVRMWEHAATKRNVARLRADGVHAEQAQLLLELAGPVKDDHGGGS